MTVDWTETEGTVAKIVYFTFNDCNGDAMDLSGYATRTLKVWNDEAAVLKFSVALTPVDDINGRFSYTIGATDIAIGDEGLYFWTGEFTSVGGITILSLRGTLKIAQSSPV